MKTPVVPSLTECCFAYPEKPHKRLHGPRGYTDYESFREWLRDEFLFRCVYCLTREVWERGKRGFQIDHVLPKSQAPNQTADYGNLVYTCPWCNQLKSDAPIPGPDEIGYGQCLAVQDDGVIVAKDSLGRILIEGFQLNEQESVNQRRRLLENLHVAGQHGHPFLPDLLAFPLDLPDLSRRRPPGGNSRPDGVEQSCFARRQRGELPDFY